jgi:ABC-2 type transport system ATP-binding protein
MGAVEPEVAAIVTRGLRKVYGSKVAVAHLDLTVPQGTVFGFLGPNGAGKTTAIKMMLGLVRPSEGTFSIFGRPLDRHVKRLIGFLPEHFRFPNWHTPRSLLHLHASLAGVPPSEMARRIDEAIARVGLAEHAEEPLHRFSKGMQQRVGLAQAIVANPKLLFLDEPTSGLDPVGRRDFKDLIRSLKDEGVTVLLNTHILADVEALCDWIAIIDRGQVIASGKPEQLTRPLVTVELRLNSVNDSVAVALAGIPHRWTVDGKLAVTLDDEEKVPEIVHRLVARGARIYEVRRTQLSLEDVFVRLVTGEHE